MIEHTYLNEHQVDVIARYILSTITRTSIELFDSEQVLMAIKAKLCTLTQDRLEILQAIVLSWLDERFEDYLVTE